MTIKLVSLFRARDPLCMLTWRDIRVRYEQSIMGLLWSVLMPGGGNANSLSRVSIVGARSELASGARAAVLRH